MPRNVQVNWLAGGKKEGVRKKKKTTKTKQNKTCFVGFPHFLGVNWPHPISNEITEQGCKSCTVGHIH